MKFSVFFLLAAAVLHVRAPPPPAPGTKENPKKECPPQEEIKGCSCYPVLMRISCGSNVVKFQLSEYYKIDTLYISNAPDLNLLVDKTIVRGKLHADSLILKYDDNTAAAAKVPSMDLLQEVLSVSTQNVKIIATEKVKGSLDVGGLATGLNSLIIEDVKNLVNLDYEKLSGLKHLQILNSNFESTNLNFVVQGSSIKYLEIDNTNIAGFSFNPSSCDEQQIIIKVRNNKINFKNFEFSSLLSKTTTSSEKCNYHIDLSDNPLLDKSTLTKPNQVDTIQKFYKADGGGNLYLVMKQDTLTCPCKFFQLVYQKHEQYIHGLICETKKLFDNPDHTKDPNKPAKIPKPIPIDDLKIEDFDASELKVDKSCR